MSPARQFLFDSDFSDPDAKAAEEAAVEEEEPEIEEPEVDLFTEEDMQAARSAAFEQGRRKAEADFLASMESEILSLVRDIAANLTQICAIQERENAKLTGEAVSVAHAICRKVVPALFEKNSVEEVAHQVHETVQDLSAAPRILLTVAPALRGPLAERIEHIVAGSGYDGRIEVLEDETLEHGDCLMAWGDGGAERRLADIWRQIDAVVADGAEKVIKSADRGYLRVTGPEAGAGAEAGADSPHAAAPPAPQAPTPAPTPAPEPAPEPASRAVQPKPPAEPQPLETMEESEDSPAPPEAAAEAMETAAEAPIPAQTSEDEEIEAILSEIDSAETGAGDDGAASGAGDNAAASGAGDNMAGETADTVSGAEAEPFAEAPPLQSFDDDGAPPEAPSPPQQQQPPRPQPEPAAAPRPTGPAPRMEGLGIELDTAEPGGDVDNALDKALSVLSGARKPDAPPPGAMPGVTPGAMPRRTDTTEEDEDESVFGEIVDDALDIALGALSQKKKGPGGRS